MSKQPRFIIKLYLTYRGNVNHQQSVPHPLSTLPVGIVNILAAFSKLFFQISVQIYSLLDQTEGERKNFSWRVQEGEPHREITTNSTWFL